MIIMVQHHPSYFHEDDFSFAGNWWGGWSRISGNPHFYDYRVEENYHLKRMMTLNEIDDDNVEDDDDFEANYQKIV